MARSVCCAVPPPPPPPARATALSEQWQVLLPHLLEPRPTLPFINTPTYQSNGRCCARPMFVTLVLPSQVGGGGVSGAKYWVPLTRKRHIPPRSAQPRHTNDWAPRTRKRHQQEHRPQRPTERSDPTQHAKGRTGDCPGPRKGATTRRNVTQAPVSYLLGTPCVVLFPCFLPFLVLRFPMCVCVCACVRACVRVCGVSGCACGSFGVSMFFERTLPTFCVYGRMSLLW